MIFLIFVKATNDFLNHCNLLVFDDRIIYHFLLHRLGNRNGSRQDLITILVTFVFVVSSLSLHNEYLYEFVLFSRTMRSFIPPRYNQFLA